MTNPETNNENITEQDIDKELLCDFIIESNDTLSNVENDIIELEENPNNQDLVSSVFRIIHTIKGNSSYFKLKVMECISHRVENLLHDLRDGKITADKKVISILLKGIDRLKDSFTKASKGDIHQELSPEEEDLLNSIQQIQIQNADRELLYEEVIKKLESLLIRVSLDNMDKKAILSEICTLVTENKLIIDAQSNKEEDNTEQNEISTPNDCEDESDASDKNSSDETTQDRTMRIPEKKIDEFFTLVGDLITIGEGLQFIQSQLTNTCTDTTVSECFSKYNLMFNKLSTSLQTGLLGLRKVPIKQLFQRIPKMIRETANKTMKEVTCVISGEETLIDKSLLEILDAPITHLIRNSVDHGIEDPNTRVKMGKDKKGTITVSAHYDNSHIHIEISDDGKGLDPEKLKQNALEKNIINSRHLNTMSDAEIIDLIFYPGFSTKEEITNISGRGVGLDIVRDCMYKANGNINVSSTIGEGTTFTLTLPLTSVVVVIAGLLIETSGQQYIIPIKHISDCFKLSTKQLSQLCGTEEQIINHKNTLYSVIQLHTYLDLPKSTSTEKSGLIITGRDTTACILVDHLYGIHKFVLKNMDMDEYPSTNIFAGATIMGNGKMALVLNVEHLL